MGKKKRNHKSRAARAEGPPACSLALCMIVKDEEQMLPDCLASVRGLVEQLVVVDTGSSDGTVALAEAAGAQIVSFPWCDDFAAARNAALPRVETDWILMLDADERLAPGAAATIREAIRGGKLDCGFLPLLDAEQLDSRPEDVLSGAARRGDPLLLPRLFRVSPDFQWEGIVHESISTWLSGGKQTGRVDAPIIHLGNVESFRQEQGKGERNLRLLRKRVEQEPDSPVARSYLARELLRSGKATEADRQIAAGWSAAEEAWESPGEGGRPAVVGLATLRAFRALQAGDFATSVATADALDRWGVEHPNPWCMRGMALQRLACLGSSALPADQLLDRAVADFERCLSLGGLLFADEVMSGTTEWIAATELGVVRLLQGSPSLALEAFDAALESQPQHRDAHFGRIEALLDGGLCREALHQIQALLPDADADLWALGAAICLALGSDEDFALFAGKSRSVGAVGQSHPYRALRYSELVTT